MTTTDKAEPKIKRCPACGAKQNYTLAGITAATQYRYECECGAAGAWMDDAVDAIAAWNALPRRKRVGRKKAERAVAELVAAVQAPCERSPEGAARYHERIYAARRALMAMLAGEAEPTADGAP